MYMQVYYIYLYICIYIYMPDIFYIYIYIYICSSNIIIVHTYLTSGGGVVSPQASSIRRPLLAEQVGQGVIF